MSYSEQHHDEQHDPLLKEMRDDLFDFEETIFGMRLQQLLADIGAGLFIVSVSGPLPLPLRLVVCALLAATGYLLIHGTVQDQPTVIWLWLVLRSLTLPRYTTWQPAPGASPRRRRNHGPPAVQTTWVPLDTLSEGIAGYTGTGARGASSGYYWAAFELAGRNITLLPQTEQLRFFRRFERFLIGLPFRLQFLTLCEPTTVDSFPPLVAQEQALSKRRQEAPRFVRLHQATLDMQRRELLTTTQVRHFVVVSASRREEAYRARREQGKTRGGLPAFLLQYVLSPDTPAISDDFVLAQLRTRLATLRQLFQELNVRATLLDDKGLLTLFASCLNPGHRPPDFIPEVVSACENEQVTEATSPHQRRTAGGSSTTRRRYRKQLRGVHGSLTYTSTRPDRRLEPGMLRLADLLAPSSIRLANDCLQSEVNQVLRYSRTIKVRKIEGERRCGWLEDITGLGLPLVMSTTIEPLDPEASLKQLEKEQVKVESLKVTDARQARLTSARYQTLAERISKACRELANKHIGIDAVQMTFLVHASSRSRLRDRTRYLLSRLQGMRLRVRVAHRMHDACWQSMLPSCQPLRADSVIRMPTDAVSTLLNVRTGTLGTPDGVFLGWTGKELGRRPVYWHPWPENGQLANPHLVIIGDSGQGKSLTGKVITSGLIALGIADVVVLDRDDDYLLLHQYAQCESQRYNLARGCPFNFLALPLAPEHIDPEDPADFVGEFLDNQFLPGLHLLLYAAHEHVSQSEDAYLMLVGRRTFAAFGLTSEGIRARPSLLLGPMPTLADYIAIMKQTPASSSEMQRALLERLEKVAYLFSGQTSASIDTPLTIFNIRELDEKWYPFMTFVVQQFLLRHRALHQDKRYLAYIVEEASYLLRHPAGRKYLETGSRGFRKLGIAQITLSQHPREFLAEGAVVLSNAGTALFLGMQPNAASLLDLPPELEQTVTQASPGQGVLRCGNEYGPIQIVTSRQHRRLFTTSPQERRRYSKASSSDQPA